MPKKIYNTAEEKAAGKRASEQRRKDRVYSNPELHERRKAQKREYYRAQKPRRNIGNWAILAVNQKRCVCKSRGIPFDLTPEDIIIPEFCPILGIRLEISTNKSKASSPSIDRIFPEKGHVRGNVRVISHKANAMKSDCTDPEVFLRLAEYVRTA